MGTALRRATKQATKRKVMNATIDGGGEYGIAARQAKKLLSNTWIRRDGTPGAYHKPGNIAAKPMSLNARHAVQPVVTL